MENKKGEGINRFGRGTFQICEMPRWHASPNMDFQGTDGKTPLGLRKMYFLGFRLVEFERSANRSTNIYRRRKCATLTEIHNNGDIGELAADWQGEPGCQRRRRQRNRVREAIRV